MTVSSLVFFAVILLTFTNGLVYRTKDAIIKEDSNLYEPMNPFLMVRGTEFMDNLYGAIPVHPVTGLMYGPPSVYPWLIHNIEPQPTGGNGRPPKPKQTADICGAGPTTTLSFDEQGVVGETDAEKNSWPSIVGLRFGGIFFCGGSLIAPDQILTSAHCLEWIPETRLRYLTVDLGMHILRPSDAQETRTIRRVIIHGGWNPSTYAYDIGIITLSSPVSYTSTISPVCLPPLGLNSQFSDQDGAIVGWGSKSNVLQQSTVRTLTNAQCRESYGGIGNGMMCAASPGNDTFQEERGGPLVVRPSAESPWTEVGIFSFGVGFEDYVGVYTRVTAFRNWIKEYANV